MNEFKRDLGGRYTIEFWDRITAPRQRILDTVERRGAGLNGIVREYIHRLENPDAWHPHRVIPYD